MAPEKLLLFWIPDDMAVPARSIEREPSGHGGNDADVDIKQEASEDGFDRRWM
jgi:hypothetical protein